MNLSSQRIMKMGCVVREPLHCLAAQPRETAIFEGEPEGGVCMNALEEELLVGLYFVGVALPGLFVNPISRPVLVQFVFGLTLVLLAVFKISLIR
jgi:hypothetical protein